MVSLPGLVGKVIRGGGVEIVVCLGEVDEGDVVVGAFAGYHPPTDLGAAGFFLLAVDRAGGEGYHWHLLFIFAARFFVVAHLGSMLLLVLLLLFVLGVEAVGLVGLVVVMRSRDEDRLTPQKEMVGAD